MTPVQAPAAQGKLGVLSVHNAEIRADDGSTVAVCYGAPHSHADRRARILAHAHNCHAELVEALRDIQTDVASLVKELALYGSSVKVFTRGDMRSVSAELQRMVVERASAALSRATGSEQ